MATHTKSRELKRLEANEELLEIAMKSIVKWRARSIDIVAKFYTIYGFVAAIFTIAKVGCFWVVPVFCLMLFAFQVSALVTEVYVLMELQSMLLKLVQHLTKEIANGPYRL